MPPHPRRPFRKRIVLQREAHAPAWHQHLTLPDGRALLLRPIAPADAGPLRQGFALLTPEAAHRLTHLDPKREFALVAAEPLPEGEALVGAVARVSIEGDGRRAEFAILVSRFLAGQGLGALMLRRLIRWARLKRLDELYGDVLDENRPMLALAHALGFRRELLHEEPGLVRVSLDLRR